MDPLRRSARASPDALAVVEASALASGSGPHGWTYEELDARVDRAASALQRAGVRPGHPVAVRIHSSPECVALIHGIWRTGATALMLDPSWPDLEVQRVVESIGSGLLAIEEPGVVEGWLHSGKTDSVDPRNAADPATASEQDFDPDGVAAWIPTSGTTGVPRLVGITHGNLSASAVGARARLDLESQDRWMTSLSAAHIGGLAMIHRSSMIGSGLVTHPRFDVGLLSLLGDQGGVTHASLVPVMFRRLLESREGRPAPSGLRCLLVGGATLDASLLERALELGYPVALTYGMTETTSQVATAAPPQVRGKPGTVGRPLQGVELRIDEARETESGEILVRGPTVAPDAETDADGWLRTGDLGALDPEGDLWVTGRASDRIVTGGVTVDPAETEAVLLEHPAVREVAIVGVPDPTWGERIVAVAVPQNESAPPTLEDLLEFSRSRLRAAKRPRELRVVVTLPRTANGKLDRGRLRSLSS